MIDKPSSEEVIIDPSYRGYICNRLLTTSLPFNDDQYLRDLTANGFSDNEPLGGELEHLCMDVSELTGKVLDVGLGGGRSLLQAVQNGIDMYGVEIALKAKVGAFHPGARIFHREELARDSLRRVINSYPDRIIEADAAQEIPYPGNSFDTVIACISLPAYARNRIEAVRSVMEMIRVSKAKVAFVTNYSKPPEVDETMSIGVGRNTFDFCLVNLLKDLEGCGISTSWRQVNNRSRVDPRNIVSAHLDVTNKNQGLISSTNFLDTSRSY